MAQVKFEREEHYVLEKLMQGFVEKANRDIAASVRKNPRGPLKSLQIEHVSFGNNPPYVEITRVRSAAEFPPGLVPKPDDRPTAKQLVVELDGSSVGCSVKTLKGKPVTLKDIMKTLPLVGGAGAVKRTTPAKGRRRRHGGDGPAEHGSDDAGSDVEDAVGEYVESEEAEEDEEAEEAEDGGSDTIGEQAARTTDQSHASYLSLMENDAVRPQSPETSFEDDDEVDEYVCPGFMEALSKHVMGLVPQDLTQLLGPHGAWIEATLSYAGDFELQLTTVLGADLTIGEERPLKNFVSLPITCRMHSLRLHTSVELLLQDQHLTVYAIPETPYTDWDSCFSLGLELSFEGRPYVESSERLSELVSSVLSEALVDHCLWPNSLRVPLHELDATVHRIMSQWVMRNTSAR